MNPEIQRLEEKIAYLERHVTEQDRAMLEQAEELARVRRDIATLRVLLGRREPTGEPESASDERPPHY